MLKKKSRITGKKKIPYLLRKGNKKYGKYLMCRYQYPIKEIDPKQRFAFLISSKIYKRAVDRNKLRRRLTEIVRLFLHQNKDFPKSCELVILPLASVKEAQYIDLDCDLKQVLTAVLT